MTAETNEFWYLDRLKDFRFASPEVNDGVAYIDTYPDGFIDFETSFPGIPIEFIVKDPVEGIGTEGIRNKLGIDSLDLRFIAVHRDFNYPKVAHLEIFILDERPGPVDALFLCAIMDATREKPAETWLEIIRALGAGLGNTVDQLPVAAQSKPNQADTPEIFDIINLSDQTFFDSTMTQNFAVLLANLYQTYQKWFSKIRVAASQKNHSAFEEAKVNFKLAETELNSQVKLSNMVLKSGVSNARPHNRHTARFSGGLRPVVNQRGETMDTEQYEFAAVILENDDSGELSPRYKEIERLDKVLPRDLSKVRIVFRKRLEIAKSPRFSRFSHDMIGDWD